MSIKYYKLFDLLNRRGLKKTDLLKLANISSPTLAKLSRGDIITTEIIEKICIALKVQPGDIMEYVSNVKNDE
ncbi:MAG: helix-turn-helix transcriptional regulator [Oscillospiraceae bacterium]|nr:helix-turn-helix transcriptional regulator [Oscillospiraceae bacterium]